MSSQGEKTNKFYRIFLNLYMNERYKLKQIFLGHRLLFIYISQNTCVSQKKTLISSIPRANQSLSSLPPIKRKPLKKSFIIQIYVSMFFFPTEISFFLN